MRISAKPASLAATLLVAPLSSCAPPPGENDFAELSAEVETVPVPSAGDAADDPAIWVNSLDPAESRILGTDKKKGLAIYDLQGRQTQFLARGRLNNVDVRQGVMLAGQRRDIAVATNRSLDSLDVFDISANGEVRHLTMQDLSFQDPYGVCLHHDQSGRLHAFVNDKSGLYQQWRIDASPSATDAPLVLTLAREFTVRSKPEGCVADDASGTLYVGEEARGVWKLSAAPDAETDMELIAQVGDALAADVEGLAIHSATDGQAGYLVVSSQGNDSYAVFDIADDSHRGSFRIVDNPRTALDGTEETDGIAVVSSALNATFPDGLLVVQDGSNTAPKENQNFKLVSWRNVKIALKL